MHLFQVPWTCLFLLHLQIGLQIDQFWTPAESGEAAGDLAGAAEPGSSRVRTFGKGATDVAGTDQAGLGRSDQAGWARPEAGE